MDKSMDNGLIHNKNVTTTNHKPNTQTEEMRMRMRSVARGNNCVEYALQSDTLQL